MKSAHFVYDRLRANHNCRRVVFIMSSASPANDFPLITRSVPAFALRATLRITVKESRTLKYIHRPLHFSQSFVHSLRAARSTTLSFPRTFSISSFLSWTRARKVALLSLDR